MINGVRRLSQDFWNIAMEQAQIELNRAFGGWPELQPAVRDCPVDFIEDATKVSMRMELIGFTLDDIRLEVQDGILNVTADRCDKKGARSGHNAASRFEWNLALPANIDLSAIRAQFQDGVLGLTLAKRPPHPPRRIPVT